MENKMDYIHLPLGTKLNGKYKIEKIIAERSNFGIVYLANKTEENKKVVIKEFFPKKLALRDLDGKNLIYKSKIYMEKFRNDRKDFIEEAEIMEECKGENIVKIKEYFKANNTIYIVMEYCKGKTLDNYVKEKNLSIKSFIKTIYLPLVKSIHKIHKKGYLHRDIKPTNVIILETGEPILIDFGSAVSIRKESKKKIRVSPGFSPIEFYSESTKQGRYSDIYSMAAILYYFLTKKTPREARKRIFNESLKSTKEYNEVIPKKIDEMILRNLSLDSKKRDKSARHFKFKLMKEYYKSRFFNKILGRA
ncbi:MAG: serine/threonine protein kinase [Fusobacteriota bacterium]